eukprot:5560137-Amphidinium_carterae.1
MPEPANPGQAELKLCKCCLAEKSLTDFDLDGKGKIKGAMCSCCNAASEALQMMMRTVWKEQYKVKYALFKSKQHQDKWRSVVVALARDQISRKRLKLQLVLNPNQVLVLEDPAFRKRRALKITAETLASVTSHGVRSRQEMESRPMTWE